MIEKLSVAVRRENVCLAVIRHRLQRVSICEGEPTRTMGVGDTWETECLDLSVASSRRLGLQFEERPTDGSEKRRLEGDQVSEGIELTLPSPSAQERTQVGGFRMDEWCNRR